MLGLMALLIGPKVVEVAEEQPQHGLSPQGLPLELRDHIHEPGASDPPVAEYPDDVLRVYAPASGVVTVQPRSQLRKLPVLIRQSLFEAPVLTVHPLFSLPGRPKLG